MCYIVDDDDGDKVTVAKMILLKTKKMVMKMVMTRCWGDGIVLHH